MKQLPKFDSKALNPGITKKASGYLEAIKKIEELYQNNEYLSKITNKKNLGEQVDKGELCASNGMPVAIERTEGGAEISKCLPVKQLQEKLSAICSALSFDEYKKDESLTHSIIEEARKDSASTLNADEFVIDVTPSDTPITLCTIDEAGTFKDENQPDEPPQLTMTAICIAETDNDRTFDLPITASIDAPGKTISAYYGNYCATNKKEEVKDEK